MNYILTDKEPKLPLKYFEDISAIPHGSYNEKAIPAFIADTAAKQMCIRDSKYGVLVVFVFLLPNLMVNVLGMGDPTFCKYLCPQGILEGALPLAAVSENTRAALGALFQWKFALLLAVVLLSMMVSRPFCKYLCPLGAIYALFNKFSLYRLRFLPEECVRCGK